jgi:hypothetical protein
MVRLANNGENTIAGWKLTANQLSRRYAKNNTTDYLFGMQILPNSSSYNAIAIGEVSKSVTSWAGAQFRVTNAGKLHATGADIEGTITATDGKIGNWNIDGSRITTSRKVSGVTQQFYLASASATNEGSWVVAKNGSTTTFQVTKDGILKASGADIEGDLSLETNKAGIYFSSWLWSGTGNYFAQLEFQDKSTNNRTGIIADWDNSEYNYHINFIYPSGTTYLGKAQKIFSIKKNGNNAELTFAPIFTSQINTHSVFLTTSSTGRGSGKYITYDGKELLLNGSNACQRIHVLSINNNESFVTGYFRIQDITVRFKDGLIYSVEDATP